MGDRVWLDQNGDGVQDSAEKGLPGVRLTVTYLGADGVAGGGDDVAFGTSTDSAGAYVVSALPAGSYLVTVDPSSLPSGLRASYDLDGVGTANVAGLTLATEASALNVDFGYREVADLSVTQTQIPRPADLGPELTIRITVTNLGPGVARKVSFSDQVHYADYSDLHVSGPGWSCVQLDGPFSCELQAELPAGQSASVDVTTAVSDPQRQGATTTVTVSSDTPDPDVANNTSVTAVELTLPDVSLAVSLVGGPGVPGGTAQFTYAVTDKGPYNVPMSAVMLHEQLPEQMTLVSVASNDWDCTPVYLGFTCVPKHDLLQGSTTTVRAVMTAAPVDDPVSVVNRAWVTLTYADPTPADLESTIEFVLGHVSGTITSDVLPDTGSLVDPAAAATTLGLLVAGAVLLVAGRPRSGQSRG